MSSKRLELLLRLTASDQADSFAWYGLAMEYHSMGEIAQALATFKTLRERDPDYVPQYLMCGTMLMKAGHPAEAREWLESGLIKARERNESHALSELEEALHQIPPPPSMA
jgi:tetratricopeptide (TPR) repeat protein